MTKNKPYFVNHNSPNADDYMTPQQVRQSVYFGNMLARRIDINNDEPATFRFDAAIRHAIEMQGTGMAAKLAMKVSSHSINMPMVYAFKYVEHLKHTKADNITVPLFASRG